MKPSFPGDFDILSRTFRSSDSIIGPSHSWDCSAVRMGRFIWLRFFFNKDFSKEIFVKAFKFLINFMFICNFFFTAREEFNVTVLASDFLAFSFEIFLFQVLYTPNTVVDQLLALLPSYYR